VFGSSINNLEGFLHIFCNNNADNEVFLTVTGQLVQKIRTACIATCFSTRWCACSVCWTSQISWSITSCLTKDDSDFHIQANHFIVLLQQTGQRHLCSMLNRQLH